ncbi:MAG: hypothetical protein EA400_09505 [Chromatiaceae bacterium]|nr:MAG: hypothetical protein EA400_09505 [Chromatiaceae bacterium]
MQPPPAGQPAWAPGQAPGPAYSPAYGQAAYGVPAYGQAAYGAPAYGPAAYGAPAYGAAPHGAMPSHAGAHGAGQHGLPPGMQPSQQPGQQPGQHQGPRAQAGLNDLVEEISNGGNGLASLGRMLNLEDSEFWKGALIGAAAVLVVTNDAVHDLLFKTGAAAKRTVQGGTDRLRESVGGTASDKSGPTQG